MSESLLAFLFLGTLLFSIAVLLVALLRWPLRRLAGAQTQYQLWLLVPAVLLSVGLAALQPQRPLQWQIELPVDEMLPVRSAEPTTSNTPLAALDDSRPLLPSLLLGAWLLGGLGCAGVWGSAQQSLLRRRRLAAGASAALIGVWRPQLRLPADFRQRFPADERRLILLHERLHAQRGDTRWLLLALSLVAAQWFNPLAWWALHRMRADMELACDAALLRRHPGQWKTYRQALLRAQGLPSRLPLSATPCSSHPLIERLSMLPTHSIRAPRRWLAALVVGLAAGLAYAAQPAQAPLPALPAPPVVPALKTVAAPPVPAIGATLAQAPQPPTPPGSKAKTVPLPSTPSTEQAPSPPEPPAAPTAVPMLRTDVKLTVGGQVLEGAVLLEAFDRPSKHHFKTPSGQELELELRGNPADESRFPKDAIMLKIKVVNPSNGEVLFQPWLVTGDGVEARIERGRQGADGSPDPDFIRIDVLSRRVQSHDTDADTARASLHRDIDAGRAPAFFKR